MAKAEVTVRLTPSEFDLLRDAVTATRDGLIETATVSKEPRERSESRATAARLDDLLRVLK